MRDRWLATGTATDVGEPTSGATHQDARPPQDAALDRGDMGRNLARSAVRGTAQTLVSQWGRFVLRLGSTVVLARLLGPEEYGLIAMVIAITGLAELLSEFGLSNATIQRRTLTDAQVSALFWLNVAMGVVTTAAAAALAPAIAALYDRPELVPITLGLCWMFLFGSLGVQHLALLGRQMQFRRLAVLEVASMALGVTVALVAAWQGAGYWALVALHLTNIGSRTVMAWVACQWRPSRPARAAGLSGLVSFGANLSVYSVLSYAARNVDNIIIGTAFGPAALGIYTKAYQLLLLPLRQLAGPLGRVALPTLSALQDTDERFRRYYRTALRGLAFVLMPLLMIVAAVSEEVVAILLGSQWLDAAPIFQVLAFAGIAQTIMWTTEWIFQATGHAGRQAVWALISRPILVASFFVGLPFGPVGVATAYTVTNFLLLVPEFWFALRTSVLTAADVLAAVTRPVVLSLAAFGVTLVVRTALVGTGTWITLLSASGAGALLYLLAYLVVPGVRRDLGELGQLVNRARKKPAAATAGGPSVADPARP